MFRIKRIAIAVLLIFLTFVAVYYGACLYALKSLGDSARSGNGEAVLALTDLPRLRRSLALQILTAYEQRPGGAKPPNVLQQLLKSAAPNIADQLVAQFLTPQRLSEMLSTGRTQIRGNSQPIEMPAMADLRLADAISRVRFVNPVTLSFRTGDPAEGAAVTMHYENLAWRLSGIDLPPSVVTKIVAALK